MLLRGAYYMPRNLKFEKMKNKITILIFLILSLSYSLFAQNTKGRVFGSAENKKEPLGDVIVKWINTTKGTLTDEKGNFEISSANITDKRLVVMDAGYKTDTVDAGNKDYIEVILKANVVTEEIIVEGENKSSHFASSIQKTEVLSSIEFKKESCCDLSGCFGRNSSVDVQVTDLLTDSKELKLLGLEGAYSTILVDNMPVMGGLVSKYGVSSIAGALIDKIMISKGANSVFQGYETIGGSVNVLLKSFDNSDKLFLNAFMNSGLEKQFNGNYANAFKKWNTLFSFQTVQKSMRMDDNGDAFLDNPLVTRYYVYNKWNYGGPEDKTKLYAVVNYWNEERVGGQKDFDTDKDEASTTVYGQTVKIQSGAAYTRFLHAFSGDKVLKVLAAGGLYDSKSFYGTTKYDGRQKDFYTNIAYEVPVTKSSLLRAGFTYKYQNIKEDIIFTQPTTKTYNGEYLKNESVPGVFAEGSVDIIKDKVSLLAGLRYDYHNEHKSIVTPRILLKIEPVHEYTIIRASFGTGFRTINLFTEHTNILASSRNIIISEKLNPEKMINYGINLVQYFGSRHVAGNVNIDFYRTEFSNKIIPDYDENPTEVIFSNLNGNAESNVLQSDLAVNFYSIFDLRVSYKFIDSRYEKNGIEYVQPFNAKHRVLSAVSFRPLKSTWSFDGKLQWFGKQRLPSTSSNPPQYQRTTESQPYTIIGAQITKSLKYFEIYGGVDNLLDFRQENPIISADNPFGSYFDTSFIWGPTKGREFYLGLRFVVK